MPTGFSDGSERASHRVLSPVNCGVTSGGWSRWEKVLLELSGSFSVTVPAARLGSGGAGRVSAAQLSSAQLRMSRALNQVIIDVQGDRAETACA